MFNTRSGHGQQSLQDTVVRFAPLEAHWQTLLHANAAPQAVGSIGWWLCCRGFHGGTCWYDLVNASWEGGQHLNYLNSLGNKLGPALSLSTHVCMPSWGQTISMKSAGQFPRTCAWLPPRPCNLPAYLRKQNKSCFHEGQQVCCFQIWGTTSNVQSYV